MCNQTILVCIISPRSRGDINKSFGGDIYSFPRLQPNYIAITGTILKYRYAIFR